jgi:hypothetical protein
MYCKIGLKYLSKGPHFLEPLNLNPKKPVYLVVISWCELLKNIIALYDIYIQYFFRKKQFKHTHTHTHTNHHHQQQQTSKQ